MGKTFSDLENNEAFRFKGVRYKKAGICTAKMIVETPTVVIGFPPGTPVLSEKDVEDAFDGLANWR